MGGELTQFAFRTPTEDDADALSATAAEGLEAYRDFAAAGWEPGATDLRGHLADPSPWWLLAEVAGEAAGHVAFLPAAVHARPEPDPALAHLAALFVRRAHHGTGLAAELLRRARAEARDRGFTKGRLFCAAGYARARRFYEREGWRVAGEPFAEPSWGGLELVEYRLGCTRTRTRTRTPAPAPAPARDRG